MNRVSKAEIARRVRVSASTVTRWTDEDARDENGEPIVRKLSAQDLLALARVVGVDPYTLMGASFEEPEPPTEQPRRGRPPKAATLAAIVTKVGADDGEDESEDRPANLTPRAKAARASRR